MIWNLSILIFVQDSLLNIEKGEKMNNSFEKAVERIKGIDWNYRERYKPCFPMLISEFINRGNIFKDDYCNDKIPGMAVFSAADILEINIPFDIDGLVNDLELLEAGWVSMYLCKFYLEWSYLIALNIDAAVQHKGLYEPIIKFYERGGRMNYDKNELICGNYFWPKSCYKLPRKIILPEISDEILYKIDMGLSITDVDI